MSPRLTSCVRCESRRVWLRSWPSAIWRLGLTRGDAISTFRAVVRRLARAIRATVTQVRRPSAGRAPRPRHSRPPCSCDTLHPPVADAFCASRLGGEGGRAYGTLPTGIDVVAIIDRALPTTGFLRPLSRIYAGTATLEGGCAGAAGNLSIGLKGTRCRIRAYDPVTAAGRHRETHRRSSLNDFDPGHRPRARLRAYDQPRLPLQAPGRLRRAGG